MQKEHGEFEIPICLPQSFTCLLAAAPSEPFEYSFAALHKLLIDGLQVHHESIVDPTQQYHDQR
jgi:hypothetical protein